ncbi:MAG: hypothetical protein WCA09_08040 [Burkholderiales bacterium]
MRWMLFVPLVLVLMLPCAHAEDNTTRSAQAPAHPSSMQGTGGPSRLDFLFGDSRAWLDSDGTWNVAGDVTHRGLLCATYELGMRFGVGQQGCNNVEWVGAARYVTTQNQCNNATLRHSGGDKQPELAQEFRRITCAERLIRCSGNCK